MAPPGGADTGDLATASQENAKLAGQYHRMHDPSRPEREGPCHHQQGQYEDGEEETASAHGWAVRGGGDPPQPGPQARRRVKT